MIKAMRFGITWKILIELPRSAYHGKNWTTDPDR